MVVMVTPILNILFCLAMTAAWAVTGFHIGEAIGQEGANYVIAGFGEDGETRIFYAGETESVINADWRDPLETARQHWSNAEMLLRLNVLRAIREAEQNDLVEAYRPPLNPEPSRRTEGEDSLASPEA